MSPSYTGRCRRSTGLADRAHLDERRRACAHALLNRPWITKEEDPDLYYRIKDHYQELWDWFMDQAGFALIVTRSLAKLDKTPVVARPWMGFPEFRELLDYVFFTYNLWFLENKTEMDQFLLTDLVEQVREHMVGQEMPVTWKNYNHRLSMVRALKKMKALGVMSAVDGDEADWAADYETRDVLYEGSPHARYVLRRYPKDLTSYRHMEELSDPVCYPDTPDGAALRRRHRVYRRFLLEPLVPDRDWDEEDLYYVITQRRSLIEHLQRMFRWEGRRYKEGLLFFHPDPTGESDLFPTMSGISDLVLLVGTEVRKQWHSEEDPLYKEADGCVRVTRSEMEVILYRLKERYQAYWSKQHRTAHSGDLADELFAHLIEWGLGEWEDNTHFLLSPVLGRWCAVYRAKDLED